jgi:pentatricopeptide repeat protein
VCTIAVNAITYSALISALVKGKQPEQVLKIFEEMQQKGAVPNVITYNAPRRSSL